MSITASLSTTEIYTKIYDHVGERLIKNILLLYTQNEPPLPPDTKKSSLLKQLSLY